MNKKSTNFKKELEPTELPAAFLHAMKSVRLTPPEVSDMRERLLAYSNLHAAHESASNQFTYPQTIRNLFVNRAVMASALILMLLISGTGISYAAEDTLPGQPLYAVKVAVVEPIQGALITSTAGKAAWENELTERRLTEAATLAAQNKLATSTQEYLAEAVETHVANAQQDANQLAASGNTADALTVRSDLEAKLAAHADFLSVIDPRLAAAGDATTSDAVLAFLNTIQADRTQVDTSVAETEAVLVASSSDATSSMPILAISSSTSPREKRIIAYVDKQNQERHTEEASLFRANAMLFRFLPGGVLASSTEATSTATSTSSEIATTTDATTSPSDSE